MLENLHNEMPKGWWDIPAFIPNDGSLEAVQIFKRIMSEMCQSLSPKSFVETPGNELRLGIPRGQNTSPHNCFEWAVYV
jgi:hypothetical protein